MRILTTRWALAAGLILGASAALMVACGGDGDGSPRATATAPPAAQASPSPVAAQPSPTPAAAAPSPTQPAAGGGGTGPIAVTIVDNSFGPGTISARVGQQLQLNVTNAGQFPHSFTIDGVVDTGQLSQGQSRQLSFTPTQAGTLTFYCTVHGRAVMSGTVNVSQ